MASDVLVSESQAGNELDIMTMNHGEQVDPAIVVDILSSTSSATNNGVSSDNEPDQPVQEEEAVVAEHVEHVTPSKVLKMALAESGNEEASAAAVNGGPVNGEAASNGEATNGHHCNGASNGEANGHLDDENVEPTTNAVATNGNGDVKSADDEFVVTDETGHEHHVHQTVVVTSENAPSPDGGLVETTTTTVVNVDETHDGETQVIKTTVRTVTVSLHSSDVLVECGPNDAPLVEAHHLTTVTEIEQPAMEVETAAALPQTEIAASIEVPVVETVPPAAEAAAGDTAQVNGADVSATVAAPPVKQHKEGAARRLFNFVRSPAKQQKQHSLDEPSVTAEVKAETKAEAKVKSPPHQRKLFGWKKTWTPEKAAEHEKAAGTAADGELATNGAAEGEDKHGKKHAKTEAEASAPIADQPAALPPKAQKKAKKNKTALVEASAEGSVTTTDTAPSTEEKVSPKKKLRLGNIMKKSKSTTNESPAKASATEKWTAEKCTEEVHEHKAPNVAADNSLQEHATPIAVNDSSSKPAETDEKDALNTSATERWVNESCTERPSTPLKEEAKVENVENGEKVEVEKIEKVEEVKVIEEVKLEEEVKKEVEVTSVEAPPTEAAPDVEASAANTSLPVTESAEKSSSKPSNVRKSWTFRVNRSATEDKESPKKASTLKEAPAVLGGGTLKPAYSPGKPFFSGLLHRKNKEATKKAQEESKAAPVEAAAAVPAATTASSAPTTEIAETAANETATAAPPVSSMSMPLLTPEKATATERWAAEACPGEPPTAHALSSTDVVVDIQPSTSTAVKKDLESSPMRRSASLRMPSSLSRFFRFLGPRHRNTTVDGTFAEEPIDSQKAAATCTTPPPVAPTAPHTTSLTTPVSPLDRGAQEVPASDSKTGVTTTPGRHSGGFRFWSTWRSSGGPSSFGRFRRKDKHGNVTETPQALDDTSLIVNTSLIAPAKSATLHDMPRGGVTAPTVDLGAILARLPPPSPNDHSPTYIGISRVLNGYAEYNSPTRRSGASSAASHKSPGAVPAESTPQIEEQAAVVVECSGNNSVSLLQTVCQSSEASSCRDAFACLATADAEAARLEGRCAIARPHLDAPELTAEARGQIEATLGKTNLLLTQKFKQFRELCHESMKPPVEGHTPPPNATDLAGFWDLVLIQVTELDRSFDGIEKMKDNGWLVISHSDNSAQAPTSTNGTAQSGAESADSNKQKKKKEKSKSKNKSDVESGGENAAASAKSRFAEFKQRMFKRPAASAAATVETAATNGCEISVNGVNGGEASTGVTVTVAATEEAKS